MAPSSIDDAEHIYQAEATERPGLAWPPPGLERLQGDLWHVIRRAAAAGLFLVLPLLVAITREGVFWSLGPFEGAWWILLASSAVGIALLLEAYVALARIFRRAARANLEGYSWGTVALVAADASRDTGFLIQGAREFSVLEPRERRRVAHQRLWIVGLHLVSALWVSVGFSIAVIFAAAGLISPSGLAWGTLLPPAILASLGFGLGFVQRRWISRARRIWYRHTWTSDLEAKGVRAWQDAYEELVGGPAQLNRSGTMRRAAWLVSVLAALAILPAITVVPASTVGPILGSVSIPQFARTQKRGALVEAYRPYRLPAQAGVTAGAAGALVRDLILVGQLREQVSLERRPDAIISVPWIPPAEDPGVVGGVEPWNWSTTVFRMEMDEASRAYLSQLEDHPARELFARVARSWPADIVGGRLELPLPPDVAMYSLPIPHFTQLRNSAYAHIGLAGAAYAAGDVDAAELILREVISVGFILADDGPTLIDNLIGFVMIEDGGSALEGLYTAAGRTGEAKALRQAREAIERAHSHLPSNFGSSLQSNLSLLVEIAADETALRGLRWEFLALTSTLVPCLNAHSIVFGPDEDYAGWLETVKATLVRFPGEDALFTVAQEGFARSGQRPNWLARVLSLTMGKGDNPASCAAFFSANAPSGGSN